MNNGKNEEEKKEKQGIIQSRDTKLILSEQKKPSLATTSIAFYCNYTEMSIYHARFCPRDLSDSDFVGLKIRVEALVF